MGQNYFKGDVLLTDTSKTRRGLTTQSAAREAFASGNPEAAGRCGMFIACASK